MRFEDFEYDGKRLSDFGFMVCEFGTSGGGVDVKEGSTISFNTVSNTQGTKHYLINSKYDNVLEDTFQICRTPECGNDLYDNKPLSTNEIRTLTRWLSRKSFHKFKIIDYEYAGIYFEASFNISYVYINGEVYGLELKMTTNRPFALKENEDYIIRIEQANQTTVLTDESDDEGYIYPHMVIQIDSTMNGASIANEQLTITNSIGDETSSMVVKNCNGGEEITIDYPIIYSSSSSHPDIQNDFNWKFFGIGNNGVDRDNKITVSLPCTIKLSYSPIARIGL